MRRTIQLVPVLMLFVGLTGCKPTKESACEHMRKIRATPGDPSEWLSACVASFDKLEAKVTLNTEGATKQRAQENMQAGYRCVMDASDQAGLDACGADLETKMQALLRYR